MEVLKERSKVWRRREHPSGSAPRTSTSSSRYFVATGQTETNVTQFSGSLFLGSHNQHFPEHSFVIVFSSSWTLSLKVQATFQSPCKNASLICLDTNSLFKRSTSPSHLVSKRLCPNIWESLPQNQLNFKHLRA